jgi:hypothetical protein
VIAWLSWRAVGAIAAKAALAKVYFLAGLRRLEGAFS